MERIIAVAVRGYGGLVGVLFPPARHCHVMRLLCELNGQPGLNWEEGFLTDEGRFVSRREAYKIADAAGQIISGAVPHGHTELFSEDVW